MRHKANNEIAVSQVNHPVSFQTTDSNLCVSPHGDSLYSAIAIENRFNKREDVVTVMAMNVILEGANEFFNYISN